MEFEKVQSQEITILMLEKQISERQQCQISEMQQKQQNYQVVRIPRMSKTRMSRDKFIEKLYKMNYSDDENDINIIYPSTK